MPTVLKSGNLNLLEPSGPVQAYNGIAFTILQRVTIQKQQRESIRSTNITITHVHELLPLCTCVTITGGYMRQPRFTQFLRFPIRIWESTTPMQVPRSGSDLHGSNSCIHRASADARWKVMPVVCPIYLWITLQQCHSTLCGYSIVHNKQLCTGKQ